MSMLDRFLKGATEKRTRLNTVDTVAVNRHQMPLHGHDIHKAG
jgi:hypothetical protein